MPPIAVRTRVEMELAEQHTHLLSKERKRYIWRLNADLPTFLLSGVLILGKVLSCYFFANVSFFFFFFFVINEFTVTLIFICLLNSFFPKFFFLGFLFFGNVIFFFFFWNFFFFFFFFFVIHEVPVT